MSGFESEFAWLDYFLNYLFTNTFRLRKKSSRLITETQHIANKHTIENMKYRIILELLTTGLYEIKLTSCHSLSSLISQAFSISDIDVLWKRVNTGFSFEQKHVAVLTRWPLGTWVPLWLKPHPYPRYAGEMGKNTGHLGFVFEKISVGGIFWLW